MKSILTRVATATLFTGLALSSATATSLLVSDGNKSITDADKNISIDIAGEGSKDTNMTFIPGIDASPGSSFVMQFTNGGFKGNESITLCNGATKVGNLQSRGTLVGGLMVRPTFQFDPNADQSKIVQDTNITFNTDANCSLGTVPEIVSSATEPCQKITAQVVTGKSTQGTEYHDYDTAVFTIGTTKQFIKIACSAPECFVSNDNHQFLPSVTPAGVNLALTPVNNNNAVFADTNATDVGCPHCPQAAVAGQTNCTTIITLKNTSTNNNELNVTKLDFVATFDGTLGADMNVTIDNNNTAQGYTLGQKFSPNDIELSSGKEVNLTIEYTLKDTDTLALGNVMGTIDGLETNTSKHLTSKFENKVITTMKHGPSTDFTVPYMSSASASKVNFVRISTVVGSAPTTLSAVISDEAGHTCPVTYPNGIPGNGGSVQVFASAVPSVGNNIALIPEGKCTNLTSKFYSVNFSAGASVNVVSFMRTKAGERTLKVF